LKKAAVERATAEAQKDQMGVIELSFERQAGEHGQLFGSVTSMDIAEALQQKGYEIDRRKIVLRQPIKETGDFNVKVKLHRDVLLDVPVHVTAIGGEEAAPAEEGKAEKRTRRGSKKAEAAETESADAATAAAPADETAAE
jgi:large subunit ribosomal protein L9